MSDRECPVKPVSVIANDLGNRISSINTRLQKVKDRVLNIVGDNPTCQDSKKPESNLPFDVVVGKLIETSKLVDRLAELVNKL